MQRRDILCASLLLAAAACGGSKSNANASSEFDSGSPSSGKTFTADSLTLTLDPFTVAPGAEVYYCQNFANPFAADTEIAEFDSHMTAGSHHLLLFYKEGVTADGALETCSGLEVAPTPYGSQTPDGRLVYPAGVAALITKGTGLRLQSHYLNTTANPIAAHVELTMHVAAPATVQSHAGLLFVVDRDINVPAGAGASATMTDDCTIPMDMNLLGANSHMHRHGTNFVATVAGNVVYETQTWSEPRPAAFNPPLVLHAGDALHFECTFVNDGDQALTFGESAQTNEMCIFGGPFYPLPDGSAVTVGAANCMTAQQ